MTTPGLTIHLEPVTLTTSVPPGIFAQSVHRLEMGRRMSSLGAVSRDITVELEAARSSAIVVDRSDRGKLVFTGEDRASFLHGMLTNTVEGLGEGEGNHSALTDVKGSTQSDMWVYNWGDRLMVETEPAVQQKVAEFLERYIIADDVTITDETSRLSIVGIQGPDAAKLVREISDIEIDLEPYGSTTIQIAGTSARICRRSYINVDGSGYDLWLEAGAEAVFKAIVAAGATPAGEQALEILRIEAGIPRYGADVDERVVPLEGGLVDTVDFTKGCFIGQEVLGKMKNIGKPRRYLVGIEVESNDVPPGGTELTAAEKVVGLVKSGVRSDRLGKTICLASVRRGSEEPGTRLTGAGVWSCEVVSLPFE